MSNHANATEVESAATTEKENTQTAGAGNWLLKLNPGFLGSFSVVLGACVILYLAVPEQFVVTSYAIINVAVLYAASVGVGYLFKAVGIPSLLGSLIAGIVLQNAVDNFKLSSRFGEIIQTVGLCIILLISSTEIDTNAVAKAGSVSLRLTFLPGLVEAIGTAAVSHWIFGMPFALALSLGFILAAVSPAIVIPGMTGLQRMGYGVGKGIPSLVMAACALDDIVAITGFTICIGIAMDDNNVALVAFVHGPIAILLGVVTGCVAGMVLAAVRFCPYPWQRTAIAIELGLLMICGFKRVRFDGSGAVATLLMGIVAKLIWERKRVIELTQCEGTEFLLQIGRNINIVWDVAVLPLLFGSIGSAFDLNVMPTDSIFKSCIIIITGLFVRLPTAFLSAYGNNLTTRERLFVATSWTPKATVQAALCSLPLSTIKKTYSEGENYNYNQLIDWGTQIMTTAILAILITAPVGLLSIQFLGPYLLSRESQQSKAITR